MQKKRLSKLDTIKVLVVSIAIPPFRNAESLQFSKYLKFLWSPKLKFSLVTGKRQNAKKSWRQTDTNYQRALENFEQIVEVPATFPRYAHGIIRRLNPGYFQKPDNERLFIKGWQKAIKNLDTNFDIIYSRSTPFSSAIMASKLQQFYQIPWIMHLSDPWALSPISNFKGSILEFHRRQEFECFSKANKVCMTSFDQISLYQERYPQFKDKMEWFPNVFDDEHVSTGDVNFTDPLTFVHTGNFYGQWRSPEPFLKAIRSVANEVPEVIAQSRFLFAGFQEAATSDLMRPYHKYGVEYLGPKSVTDTIALLRKATVLVAIDLELPPKKAMFFPSKILDYMAARKPILAITPRGSTVYHQVQNNLGKCFSHDDVDGIKNHIIEIFERYQSKDQYFKAPYEVDCRFAASHNAQRLNKLICGTAKSLCIE